MNRLERKCAVRASDTWEIRDEINGVCLAVTENVFTYSAYLNEETARELFNWLGVWLHKHRT